MKLLWSTLAIAAILSMPSAARAYEDTVEEYGVSPVQPCPTINHPPSAAEAAQLVTCAGSYDYFNHAAVYRVYNVQVQVAPPRAYTYGDPGGNEIDPKAPIYPIRGSKSLALCSPLDGDKNAGKNCSVTDYSGYGICYMTPFNDWKCVLNGDQVGTHEKAPPPG